MLEHDAGTRYAPMRRYEVQLFVIHPTLDTREISRNLGLNATIAHQAGARRRTPSGVLLPGVYPDTRWRHSRRYETMDQHFAGAVVELIEFLSPHKAFLNELANTGGEACLIVALLGDGYFGDKLSSDLLRCLAELDMHLGFECFTVPQGTGGMRNIQVIDRAKNCTFSIFQATHDEFALLFAEPGQDIQYAEDLADQAEIGAALERIWERPIRKQDALGIDGTLLYGLQDHKALYQEKREDAVIASAINPAQRHLFET